PLQWPLQSPRGRRRRTQRPTNAAPSRSAFRSSAAATGSAARTRLCGPRLTTSERARFTRRRKEAYEALHPETKQGGDRKSSRQVGDLKKTDRFTANTSAATGQSERAVQRDAERGCGIWAELRCHSHEPARCVVAHPELGFDPG